MQPYERAPNLEGRQDTLLTQAAIELSQQQSLQDHNILFHIGIIT